MYGHVVARSLSIALAKHEVTCHPQFISHKLHVNFDLKLYSSRLSRAKTTILCGHHSSHYYYYCLYHSVILCCGICNLSLRFNVNNQGKILERELHWTPKMYPTLGSHGHQLKVKANKLICDEEQSRPNCW